VTANGRAYATVFGPYADPPTPTSVIGKILYLAPGSEKWVQVANDLNYANGIGISPDQKTLYVSETVGNCILKFTINDDGSLSHRSNFALLTLLTKNKNDSWWLGPDSMKIDNKGNIYVAQWFGGKILKISPDGNLLHVFEGRIVRDGGEGSKGPTGERQHRKDQERKVASGKRACSSELPQRARRLNSNGAERRHAWPAFELSTSAEPS